MATAPVVTTPDLPDKCGDWGCIHYWSVMSTQSLSIHMSPLAALVGAVILSHALIGCSQPDTRSSSAFEYRPDVILATGVVLTDVAVNRSTDKKSPQETVVYYHYKTPSNRCVEILAEVSELWEKTLRPEAEATGAVQVTMWPESKTGYNRDYTRRRVEGVWKANYDAECPPGLR
jgi:hypothetical protein